MKDIIPKLKVGPSCIHMNISAIYESKKNLFLSFAYTNFDFIYSREHFTMFINPGPAEDYISKDNELVIAGQIDSVYRKDTFRYIDVFMNEIYNPKEIMIYSGADINLEELKVNYLDKNIPVLFSFDHYYLYEDYKKVTNDILHFHATGHMAVLHDINFDNNEAHIVDKFYSFVGPVNIDNLIKSFKSEYLKNNYFGILDNYIPADIAEDKGFEKYLVKNIFKMEEENINIDGRIYKKNFKAVQKFIEDFPVIIDELYNQKGKYAPQFLSKLLTPMILQRMSFNNLLQYANERFRNDFYRRTSQLTEKSFKLWQRIDMYNDKCFLSGKTISQSMNLYNDLLKEILIIDGEIYALLGAFARKSEI